jgi:hypothetical protein
MTTAHVDGNVLAGPLAAVFATDVTVALATCSGCGRNSRVAELHVYVSGPGMVARCPGCEQPVVRYASTPRAVMLDLRGASVLAVSLPLDQAPRSV